MGIRAFGDAMEELSKDLGSPEKGQQKKDAENLEKFWGRPQTSIKLWPDPPKSQPESQNSRDDINLEKLWGKRK